MTDSTKNYLKFVHRSDLVIGVTQVWDVTTTTGVFLGRIGWYTHWRKYTFSPTTVRPSIFDAACLTEIANWCSRQTLERKQVRAAERAVEKERKSAL